MDSSKNDLHLLLISHWLSWTKSDDNAISVWLLVYLFVCKVTHNCGDIFMYVLPHWHISILLWYTWCKCDAVWSSVSVLSRPDGALTAGMSAHHMCLLTLWCLSDRPSLHDSKDIREVDKCCHLTGGPQQYVWCDRLVEVCSLKAARHVTIRRCEQMSPLVVVPGLLSCSDCPLVPVCLRQVPVCPTLTVCRRQDLSDMACCGWRPNLHDLGHWLISPAPHSW